METDAIKEARLDARLTQQELAELVGVDQNTVSRWERGETEPSDLSRHALMEHLDLEPADFGLETASQ